jgi:multiple sugar transport system permease protein
MAVISGARAPAGGGDLLSRVGIRGVAAREAAFAYVVVGVIYIFFIGFVFFPILLALWVSLTKWDGLTPLSEARFIALQNYVALAGDQRFLNSLLTTFQLAARAYVGQLGLGLALALIVTNIPHFRAAIRLVIFTPFMLPLVAVAVLFALLMQPEWGAINGLFEAVGLPTNTWLSQPGTALNSIGFILVWRDAGYYMVLFMTALLAVPQDYYEAASIDGAGPVQQFLHVTWPTILPTFLFISVINIIANLQVFIPVYVITGGGPDRSTEVVMVRMFQTAFADFQYSQANAMAIILFAIILLATVTQFKLLRREDE